MLMTTMRRMPLITRRMVYANTGGTSERCVGSGWLRSPCGPTGSVGPHGPVLLCIQVLLFCWCRSASVYAVVHLFSCGCSFELTSALDGDDTEVRVTERPDGVDVVLHVRAVQEVELRDVERDVGNVLDEGVVEVR